ncbi:MAG: hypothetical protein ACI8WB_005362, partial [Phenylobacterium sp.]
NTLDPIQTPKSPTTPHPFYYQDLSSKFAENGIVCGAFNPTTSNKEQMLPAVIKTSKNADITIIDWQMKAIGEDGYIAKKAIVALAERDKNEGGRLRLICIYTGEDPAKVAATLTDFLVGEKYKATLEKNRIVFDDKLMTHWRLDVISKDKTEQELAGILIDSFAQLTAGLLSSAALCAITEVRDNTHNLLHKFNQKLDPAYLSHVLGLISLPSMREQAHEVAFDYAVGIIADEIKSKLQISDKIKGALSADIIKLWPNFFANSPGKGKLKFKIGKDGDHNISTSHLVELLECKDKSAVSDVLGRIGVTDSKNDAINALVDKIEKLADVDVDGAKVKAAIVSSKAFKNKKPIDNFEKSAILLKADDDDYSHIALCIAEATRRSQSDIKEFCSMSLKQGTILQASAEDYYVCIQPLCDSVRLKDDVSFVFIKADMHEFDFNLIVGDHNNVHKLKVKPNPKQLVNLTFTACEQEKMVVGIWEEEQIIFKTKCFHDIEENNPQTMDLVWVGEIKEGLSQSYVNQAAAAMSRVGIDINEWARLHKLKDV